MEIFLSLMDGWAIFIHIFSILQVVIFCVVVSMFGCCMIRPMEISIGHPGASNAVKKKGARVQNLQ